jgi:hypothetical protein
MDRGARVLVVGEGTGSSLETVPWNRPEELGIEEEIQVSLNGDRSALVAVRHRCRGDYAAEVRAFFEVEGQRQKELERIYGGRLPGASVQSLDFPDLQDRSKPAGFRIEIRSSPFAAQSPEGEVLPVLDDFFETARQVMDLGILETRRHDLILGSPRRSSLKVLYVLPAGTQARSVPADREVSGRFGRLSVHWSQGTLGDRRTVVLERLIETTASRISGEDYPRFRELTAALGRLKDDKIVIDPPQ